MAGAKDEKWGGGEDGVLSKAKDQAVKSSGATVGKFPRAKELNSGDSQ